MSDLRYIFFGTPEAAVTVLAELEHGAMPPAAVVTAPDRPAGRGQKLTAPPVKTWAEEREIPIYQPERLDDTFIDRIRTEVAPQLGVVAAYGTIIPRTVLDVPQHGMLNVHPSLLPRYRGPTPVEAAIRAGDETTGVTIIAMDEHMDHGPIITSATLAVDALRKDTLQEQLFRLGGALLVNTIPQWISGTITAVEQNHDAATYTHKLTKEDGHIDLTDDAEKNWRLFRAYYPWPGVFFFTEDGTRVKITDAEYKNGAFVVNTVIPEGAPEMSYSAFRAC